VKKKTFSAAAYKITQSFAEVGLMKRFNALNLKLLFFAISVSLWYHGLYMLVLLLRLSRTREVMLRILTVTDLLLSVRVFQSCLKCVFLSCMVTYW